MVSLWIFPSKTDLHITIFAFILEYLGGLKPLGLGAGGCVAGRVCGGYSSFNLILTVSTFDIVLSRLKLTRAEWERKGQ